MAPALTIKTYDTFPPVVAVLTDSNGPINLSGAASVKFVMKSRNVFPVVLVSGPAVVVDPPNGKVQYGWSPGDTAQADTYDVEFEIVWGSGGVQTVPSAAATNPQIELDADLEGV